MATGCHPGFDRTGNSAIQSAQPENTTLEPNMKQIRSPVAEIWPFRIRHNITRVQFGPNFKEGEAVGCHRSQQWKERWWFPISFHCDHCAISNHSAEICHRISATLNSTGGGSLHFCQNFRVFPLEYPKSVMLASAESEHHRLTNREIIFGFGDF